MYNRYVWEGYYDFETNLDKLQHYLLLKNKGQKAKIVKTKHIAKTTLAKK